MSLPSAIKPASEGTKRGKSETRLAARETASLTSGTSPDAGGTT
jgi:hypothetical protein